jgi:hypothetical protein
MGIGLHLISKISIVKLRFTIDDRAAGMRALIAAAKIFDFYGSPRRAGSPCSP